MLDELLDIAGVAPRVEQAQSLLRPSDEMVLLGDNARLRALGWSRRYSLRQTLEGVFADWERRVRAGG